MYETSLSIRLHDGSLSEWKADEAVLSQYQDLKAAGLLGGALIRELIEVDPAHPPLSMRIFGLYPTGESFDELICYCDGGG